MTLKNMLLYYIPESVIQQAVYKQATLITPQKILSVEKVLIDSGAVHASYIAQSFVERYKHNLTVVPTKGLIVMADNKTSLQVTGMVNARVEMEHTDGRVFTADLNLIIIPTEGPDMIIGLPDILSHYLTMFVDMLQDAAKVHLGEQHLSTMVQTEEIGSLVTQTPEYAKGYELRIPWEKVREVAPEEEDTPDPCSFSGPLHFLEQSHDESLEEYYTLFETHIDPEFRKAVPIEKYLREIAVQVFVPQEWTGIKGIKEIDLEFLPGMPTMHKPKARPLNPRLAENAKKEFDRLKGYFYRPSTSDVCSCLVIAPKATAPFIRFCGDYSWMNSFIVRGHFPIPRPFYELEKMRQYSVFADIDWTNSYHQFLLSPKTSKMLSVQTPWGQVEPIFMPEGISPASGILQSVVREIFADTSCEQWLCGIFDNILVGGTGWEDLFEKIKWVVQRAIERNVILKFKKTWLGFDHAEFFGYMVRAGCIEITEKRKLAIEAIPFPRDMKEMRRFLGSAIYCKSWLPGYAELTGLLNDTLKKDFDWTDSDKWSGPYKEAFNKFKDALMKATALFHPNYELEWIVRTDASNIGVSAVLFQCAVGEDAVITLQPIAFVSQKFSETATRWATIEQECYGLKFGVEAFDYYLRGKFFTLETDHENLRWMEASLVPKIIRWRMYLQSFSFVIRHIPGKLNKVADWLSRIHMLIMEHFLIGDDRGSAEREIVTEAELASYDTLSPLWIDWEPEQTESTGDEVYADGEGSEGDEEAFCVQCNSVSMGHTCEGCDEDSHQVFVSERIVNDFIATLNTTLGGIPQVTEDALKMVLKKVHGGRRGHWGVSRTRKILDEEYPGHGIPVRLIAEFVKTCPVCQKERLGLADQLQPVVRVLHPEHQRATVGIDNLALPEDKNGNANLVVLVNHFTKHVYAYATPAHPTMIMIARALFSYYTTFGKFDVLASDPGSDIMGEVVAQVNKWLGIEHRVSLVDRHTSNGVEGSNGQILRHLRCLCADERVNEQWSDPEHLQWVFHIINDSVSSESGLKPYHATFGDQSATYLTMPPDLPEPERAHEYVRRLNENLQLLKQISSEHQRKVQEERLKVNREDARKNRYEPGDFILEVHNPGRHRDNKLRMKFNGPYEVIEQIKNDITVKDLLTGMQRPRQLRAEMCKPFYGTPVEARDMAMQDKSQYAVDRILGYKGDIWKRTSMYFLVRFTDGDEVWLPNTDDLWTTEAYERYAQSNPELHHLTLDASFVPAYRARINKSAITEVEPGDTIYYWDIRSYGEGWFQGLELPEAYYKKYVMPHRYTGWVSSKRVKINVYNMFTKKKFKETHWAVFAYGTVSVFDSNTMILVDQVLADQYPRLKHMR